MYHVINNSETDNVKEKGVEIVGQLNLIVKIAASQFWLVVRNAKSVTLNMLNNWWAVGITIIRVV